MSILRTSAEAASGFVVARICADARFAGDSSPTEHCRTDPDENDWWAGVMNSGSASPLLLHSGATVGIGNAPFLPDMILLMGLLIIGLLLFTRELISAPNGYEDDRGFHLAKPEQARQKRRVAQSFGTERCPGERQKLWLENEVGEREVVPVSRWALRDRG